MTAPYINRELSWLEFNQRVLDQAQRQDLPLLERIKFLAITASNLDEFFMVRVGGLQMLRRANSRVKDLAGLTPTRQLQLIRKRASKLIEDQYALIELVLLPLMSAENLAPQNFAILNASQIIDLDHYYNNQIAPLLTPLDMDADEAPILPSLRLIFALEVEDNETLKTRLCTIVIPDGLPRRIPVSECSEGEYVLIEDLMELHLHSLFPGETILRQAVFRVTRNGDIAVQEEDALDLADEMEEVLVARKFSECVRLELPAGTPLPFSKRIQQMLGASNAESYRLRGPLMLSDFMEMAFMPGHDHLKVPQWSPQPSPHIDPTLSIFENISQGDILLNHPYESFEPILRLVEEASDDPNVIAIKQVLYRTAKDSRIISALKRAAENGKQVTALVELKARFDEAKNLEKAEILQRSGVQVVYGVKGLKTHAKICLIIRREAGMLRRYCHFGTGNYNESTAKIYTDISYLTCDDQLGADASQFFNSVTGRTKLMRFRKIYPSPVMMKARLIELIHGEAERARQGEPAIIMAKMNSLQDEEMMEALHLAAEAGVRVQLNVRGVCCFKPRNATAAKHIHIVSIVDCYLEHARIFFFHHGGIPQLYIASADWMKRNLDKRVELMVPISEPKLARRLKNILDLCFEDNQQAYTLEEDGTSKLICPKAKQKALRMQEALTNEARRLARKKERQMQQMLEPHKPSDL